MSKKEVKLAELSLLMEALCEESLSLSEQERLEEIVLSDPDAMQFYLNYSHLHGTLHWDQAQGAEELIPEATPVSEVELPAVSPPASARRRQYVTSGLTAACALGLIVFVWTAWVREPQQTAVVENPTGHKNPVATEKAVDAQLAARNSSQRPIQIEASQHPMLQAQQNNRLKSTDRKSVV